VSALLEPPNMLLQSLGTNWETQKTRELLKASEKTKWSLPQGHFSTGTAPLFGRLSATGNCAYEHSGNCNFKTFNFKAKSHFGLSRTL